MTAGKCESHARFISGAIPFVIDIICNFYSSGLLFFDVCCQERREGEEVVAVLPSAQLSFIPRGLLVAQHFVASEFMSVIFGLVRVTSRSAQGPLVISVGRLASDGFTLAARAAATVAAGAIAVTAVGVRRRCCCRGFEAPISFSLPMLGAFACNTLACCVAL